LDSGRLETAGGSFGGNMVTSVSNLATPVVFVLVGHMLPSNDITDSECLYYYISNCPKCLYKLKNMGACSTSSTMTSKEKGIRFDQEPEDTASLKKVTLPTLLFSVLLSDVKIKKCSHVPLSQSRTLSECVLK